MPMSLRPLPAFADNLIWTLADGDGALVVDPGDAAPVLCAADEEGLRPTAILLTHHHPDHIGGVAALLQRWPDLPVYAPHDERIVLDCTRVGAGDVVRTDKRAFEVLEVHGHTLGHIAYFGEGILFSGDTLFSLGCGRLFEGTPAQMLASLDALAALPPDTLLCCGHEYTLANAAFAQVIEPDNRVLVQRHAQAQAQVDAGMCTLPVPMGVECAANPFLRVDVPGVRAAAERRLGRTIHDRVEVFATLRQWKDGFQA